MKCFFLAGLRSEKRKLAEALGWIPGPNGSFSSPDLNHRLNHAGPGRTGVVNRLVNLRPSLEDYPLVISVGTCGAFHDDAQVGTEICIPGRIGLCEDNEEHVLNRSNASLLLTCEDPVTNARQRENILHRWPDARYVDMETGFIIQWLKANVPEREWKYGALRVVTDHAGDAAVHEFYEHLDRSMKALAEQVQGFLRTLPTGDQR